MLAGKKETYDSIYDKIQELKTGVAAHVCRGENAFKLKSTSNDTKKQK